MAVNNRQNQQNPPLPKRKRMDAQGNNRKRFIVKDGGATTIIASGATEACYNQAWSKFVDLIEKGGGKITVQTKIIQ